MALEAPADRLRVLAGFPVHQSSPVELESTKSGGDCKLIKEEEEKVMMKKCNGHDDRHLPAAFLLG